MVGDLVVAGEAVPGLGEELLPAVRPVAGGVFDGDVGGEVVFGGVFLRDGFGGVGDVEGDVEAGEFALGFFGEYAGPFLGGDDVDDFYAVPVGVVVGADFGGDEAVDCSLGAWTGVDAGGRVGIDQRRPAVSVSTTSSLMAASAVGWGCQGISGLRPRRG